MRPGRTWTGCYTQSPCSCNEALDEGRTLCECFPAMGSKHLLQQFLRVLLTLLASMAVICDSDQGLSPVTVGLALCQNVLLQSPLVFQETHLSRYSGLDPKWCENHLMAIRRLEMSRRNLMFFSFHTFKQNMIILLKHFVC